MYIVLQIVEDHQQTVSLVTVYDTECTSNPPKPIGITLEWIEM